MSIHLRVSSDFPPKEAFVKIEEKSTLRELRDAAVEALALTPPGAPAYGFLACGFQTDVVELADKDPSTVASTLVQNHWNVFLRAPSDLKPPTARSRKNQKTEEKKESKDSRMLRYAGLTVQNALKKLVEGFKPVVTMEYIDIFGDDILKLPEFSNLDKKFVIEISKRNTLNCPEVLLFDAIVAWARAECKRQSLDDNKSANVKQVLDGVLTHIRFPLLDMKEVASKVAPSGLLEQQEMLELFTYMGMKQAKQTDIKLGTALKKFIATPREGRKNPMGGVVWHKFKWGQHGNNIIVSNEQRSAQKSDSSYAVVVGDEAMTEGRYYWELKVDQGTSDSWSLVIGVATDSVNLNSYLTEGTHGWGYLSYASTCHQSGSPSNGYGEKYAAGDVIGVLVDIDAGSIWFFKNKVCLGLAFEGIPKGVRPAAQVNTNSGISIVEGSWRDFPPTWPEFKRS